MKPKFVHICDNLSQKFLLKITSPLAGEGDLWCLQCLRSPLPGGLFCTHKFRGSFIVRSRLTVG
jgi:hypothetical protein